MRLVNLIPLKELYNPAEAFNKKVSRMTDNNDHSAAAVELAIYMDDKDAVRKLQQIKKQHDKDGSISAEDAKKRDKMVDVLLKKAKKDLTNKDYTLISNSF
jgi:outer membrane protein assembly factor BamE (lipoprotein component of BamABCDE complex)